ncbi:MAG: methionyl-tRNA formyltransferase [Pseudobutyrivibrio ruminis]|uniref:formyltransferase family protein n=1 Tax=Pseudobutyrivibrio ruminis TaxID=46206 RepID=UPI0026F1FE46|nr:formyltransferase family protein [Pseudobutyrivibrio ruminis]MBE5912912.1 methionyl-tRNA formyltransferase [Pseudobutyrivibrio ruminis]
MNNYVVATIKSWNIKRFQQYCVDDESHKFYLITDKSELTYERLRELNPRFVFFPHWSWIIPQEIYENFECVVFHMTDLPFGRGGSPLQNLIVRGIYKTKVSALRVERGLDTGDIYMKYPVDISNGNADEIFTKISDIVFKEMIPDIIRNEPIPIPQEGEGIAFSRRKQEQSEMPPDLSQRQMYDFIRMLDGEGYPAAFQRYGNGKLEYRNAELVNGKLRANVNYVEEKE